VCSINRAGFTLRSTGSFCANVANPKRSCSQQRVGEPGRPCLPWKQEIGGSNPPTLTICPRSSADESGRFLNGASGVRLTPRAPLRMVGRAARQRGANASRPSGRAGSTPAPSAILSCGRSSMAEPLPSKQKTRVRFSLPAPTSPRSSSGRGHRSFKSDGAGSNPARGSSQFRDARC
jgi:hypothetical protein